MQLSKPPKPKATRKSLKKEILSDYFKKRKIFWKNIAENFPPYITTVTISMLGPTQPLIQWVRWGTFPGGKALSVCIPFVVLF
jgi:hypothetical protein